jgi:hypothetical protein
MCQLRQMTAQHGGTMHSAVPDQLLTALRPATLGNPGTGEMNHGIQPDIRVNLYQIVLWLPETTAGTVWLACQTDYLMSGRGQIS